MLDDFDDPNSTAKDASDPHFSERGKPAVLWALEQPTCSALKLLLRHERPHPSAVRGAAGGV